MKKQTEFLIEKNIPLPPRAGVGGSPYAIRQAFLRSMEVGDSMLLDMPKSVNPSSLWAPITAKTGRRFAQRRQSDTQVRVWRVS